MSDYVKIPELARRLDGFYFPPSVLAASVNFPSFHHLREKALPAACRAGPRQAGEERRAWSVSHRNMPTRLTSGHTATRALGIWSWIKPGRGCADE